MFETLFTMFYANFFPLKLLIYRVKLNSSYWINLLACKYSKIFCFFGLFKVVKTKNIVQAFPDTTEP